VFVDRGPSERVTLGVQISVLPGGTSVRPEVSASMIVYACTAALIGYLFDRLGSRVLFPIGALCMGTGLMLD
jgi:hypothetical protein